MSNAAVKPRLIVLAGGQGRRLGGVDKSLLMRDGMTQLDRFRDFASIHGLPVSISRQVACGADEFADDPALIAGAGPISGLAAACALFNDEWLLTVPVDTVALPDDLLTRFGALDVGAYDSIHIADADGPQPLLAFWRRTALQDAIAKALESADYSIRGLRGERSLNLNFPDFRCGNINNPDDLARFDTMLP